MSMSKLALRVSITSVGPVVERSVDLRLADAGNVDPEVAGERHDEAALRAGLDVDDHDRVGTLSACGALIAEGRSSATSPCTNFRLSEPINKKLAPLGGGGAVVTFTRLIWSSF